MSWFELNKYNNMHGAKVKTYKALVNSFVN